MTSLVCDGREALSAPANRLELYEDEPTPGTRGTSIPAHLETRQDLAARRGPSRSTSTPLRAEVVFERDWITQTIRLDAGSRRLESTPRSTGSSTTSS